MTIGGQLVERKGLKQGIIGLKRILFTSWWVHYIDQPNKCNSIEYQDCSLERGHFSP